MFGITVKGQTFDLGVTKINKNVPIEHFLHDHVFPELQKSIGQPICFSRCIRFIDMFRLHLSSKQLINLALFLASKYLINYGEIISSYTSIFIGNLAKQRTKEGKLFISDNLLQPNFGTFLKYLSESLTRKTRWLSDVHTIKTLLYLIQRNKNFLKLQIKSLMTLFQQLISRSSTVTHNPEYTYYLYETFGLIINIISQENKEYIIEIEKCFGSILQGIIQNRYIEEVVPFSYQIITLLLYNYINIPSYYTRIFSFTINQTIQDSFSIPFLSLYISKDYIFSKKMVDKILNTLKKLLTESKTVRWGIDIADAILKNKTIIKNHKIALSIFKVLTQSLNSKQQKHFVAKDFTRLLVSFIIKFKANSLRIILDNISQGLYIICNQLILKYADVSNFEERRKFIIALTFLINDKNCLQNQTNIWKQLLKKCIELLESRIKINEELDRLDVLEAMGSSNLVKNLELKLALPFVQENIPSIIQLKHALAETINDLIIKGLLNLSIINQFEIKYSKTIKDYLGAINIFLD